MSDTSGEMLAELWNSLKPYIEKKERPDAAMSFLRAAEDFVDLEDAREDLAGTDASIDAALKEIVGDYDEDADEDYEEL